ncbi:MAG: dUTP diphosphatase [Erysipelotrichaceae bacterium]
MIDVKIKRLNDDAIIPTRGSKEAAGFDLYASKGTVIKPNSTVAVEVGLSLEIPQGYFGGVFARSGLASKEGIRPANCVGVIDSDYRGEIKVMLHNDSDCERIIEKGQRIAQLIIIPYLNVNIVESEQLSETERGNKGFGSTGK